MASGTPVELDEVRDHVGQLQPAGADELDEAGQGGAGSPVP